MSKDGKAGQIGRVQTAPQGSAQTQGERGKWSSQSKIPWWKSKLGFKLSSIHPHSFQCQQCPKHFKTPKVWQLREHLKKIHREGADPITCPWPDCEYVIQLTLFHILPLILQTAAYPSHMAKHVKSHEGSERVKCPHCGADIVRWRYMMC